MRKYEKEKPGSILPWIRNEYVSPPGKRNKVTWGVVFQILNALIDTMKMRRKR